MKYDNIVIEMKLKSSIIDMDRFEVYIAICDFDDFVKSIFVDNNENNYLETDDYNYQLLTTDNKTSEQMLCLLLYIFVLSFKNNKIIIVIMDITTKKLPMIF